MLFIVVGLPAITGLFTSGSADQTVEAGVEVEVNIPQGATGDQIASILSENNIIPDPQDYYAEVKAQNADMSLKPGDYRFTTLQDPADVVAQLVAGPNVQGVTLTIVEGLTVEQTAQRVEEVYGIAADDFMAQAKASNYAADYDFLADVADDSLEGFLYPKTYSFAGTPTADDIIRAMLDQYQVEVASLDFDGARATIKSRYGVELSDYDLLTMASVIEREALTEDQRYNVSSTFYNRLEAGMPLQSDATMMYVTGGAVTSEDLKRESPYNTYLNQGLPPTPICSPSLASIKAALAPADTDYLYFFITTMTSTSPRPTTSISLPLRRTAEMSLLAPDRYVASVDRIDLDDLRRRGTRAILLDRDNTLVPRDRTTAPASVATWLDAARDRGFKLYMVSNNWHRDQVERSARELGLGAICFACKPLPFALTRALKHLGVPKGEAVMVGTSSTRMFGRGTLPVSPLSSFARRPRSICGTPRSSESLNGAPSGTFPCEE